MDTEILNAENLHFFLFAERFGAPKSLRRILSLMRVAGCKTIVVQSLNWPYDCTYRNCNDRYYSCKDYIANLSKYSCILTNKKCYKFFFFKSVFKEQREINYQEDDHLLGFCIAHDDEFDDMPLSYITESIITIPYTNNGFVFGLIKEPVQIGNRTFHIEGNYFCQQNGITNCCAHAAIKMAAKGHNPHITSENINRQINIDHQKRRGFEGLDANEICNIIESTSHLSTLILQASDLDSPLDFLKFIYIAIESRLPVILLFKIPGKSPNDQAESHAVTLLGHTFNEHNWWSYGKLYFPSKELPYLPQELTYLPSFIWCDNFIVQDDNFGPHYLLPSRFLTDTVGLSGVLNALEKAFLPMQAFPFSLTMPWLSKPLTAIVVHPATLSFLKDSLKVEWWVIGWLWHYMKQLLENNNLPDTIAFRKYFFEYQQRGELILRTFLVTKKEYMYSLDKDEYWTNYDKMMLEDLLPDSFWITELSVPELFWVNKKKIGEVIIDPKKFNQNNENGVIFIRAPNMIISIKAGTWSYYKNISQGQYYQSLIEPKGLFHNSSTH